MKILATWFTWIVSILIKFEVSFKEFEEYLAANPKQYPTITGWVDRKARPDMLNKPVFGFSMETLQKIL